MTTKTLDLTELSKTFSSTYDHARRMGADRPLSHRFGLADVLGEIEVEIEKRIAAVKAEAEKAAADARTEFAATIATERARTRAALAAAALPPERLRSTSTSARALAATLRGQYHATRDARGLAVVVHPVSGKHLVRNSLDHAQRTARYLNSGALSGAGYLWSTPASAPSRFRF